MQNKDNDSHLVEKTLESSPIWRGKLLDIYLDKVATADGQIATREYTKHPGAVAIIAKLNDGSILVERQYRYPMQRVMLEIPAGKIEKDEDYLMTAKRELLEETGYQAKNWLYLGLINNFISYSNEKIIIYYASDLEKINEANPDQGEIIDVFSLQVAEIQTKIINGEITDAKTISAMYLWQMSQEKA